MRIRLLPGDREIGWTPFAWLVYLPLLLVHPILRRAPGAEWAITAGAVVVFLGLYFRGYWVRGKKLLAIVAAIALLGVIVSAVNPNATMFFIYASAFAGYVTPKRSAALMIVATLACVLALISFTYPLPPTAWIPGLVFTVVIGAVNIHSAAVSRTNSDLRRAQAEIQRLAKVEERERIARDLHDLLGHTLSLIVLKSELASRLAERDPGRAAEEIRDVETISRQALAEVRAAVAGYRAGGMARALDEARSALTSAGIRLHTDVASLTLRKELDDALALVTREAVTNIIRHAAAKTCRITLEESGENLLLEISDDGVGSAAAEGNGITGMRERVRAVGGSFVTTSGEGTTITITVPVAAGGRTENGPAVATVGAMTGELA